MPIIAILIISQSILKGGIKMFEIRYTVRVNDIFKSAIEGVYKSKLIAERHLRKLKRKYRGTEFKMKELLGR